MKFGIHHSSWLDGPDPAGAFDTAKAKAEWAEDHGFTWFSVMDHTIQIPRVGAPDEPVLEGWAVLAGWPPSPAVSASPPWPRRSTIAIQLIGQYQDAGVDLLIESDRRNDPETLELFASEVMPRFA